MKPLEINQKPLTRIMLIGGQDVIVEEGHVEIDRKIGNGGWMSLTAPGCGPSSAAIHAEAVVGFHVLREEKTTERAESAGTGDTEAIE